MNYNQPQSTSGGGASASYNNYSGQYQQQQRRYGNYSNTTVARDNLGSYNQNMGTLTQNGLRVLDGLLHNTT